MAIENAILPNDQLDILTVPAGKSYAITTILVCNYATTDSANFDLHIIKSGGARGNANIIVNDLELPAGETFTFDSEKIVLEEGDFISFVASPDNGTGNSDLSATVSYLEV
jgi:hypothetical protein